MRLLNVHTFKFKQFETDIPPYAILSHRWSESEPRLADVERWYQQPRKSVAKRRRIDPPTLYNKVDGFASYVREYLPDTEWIWIDSCCIDQANAAELSEAINRMFAWYRDSRVCLAYLPDVEHPSDTVALRNSVWFKRGWTLQELVASTVVVFLTNKWQIIGHKGATAHLGEKLEAGADLESLLHEVTKLPRNVLQDYSNSLSSSLTSEEKMLWMDGRQTQKEEDIVYAMFGLIGVTPGANYGEGMDSAKRRLMVAINEKEHANGKPGSRDNEQLPPEIEAWLSPPDPSPNHASARERHEPNTCTWLLQHQLYTEWKAGRGHLWLHGKPGCGKSVLCSTVIEDLLEHYKDKVNANVWLAYFYFTFSDDHKQNYHDLVLALACKIGTREPARSLLNQVYQKPQKLRTRPSTRELENILVQTAATYDEAIIVLDALDEVAESNDTRFELLEQLRSLLRQAPKLRLFATSRSISDIRDSMEALECEQISVQPTDVSKDIQHYVAKQLSTEPRLRKFTPTIKSMIEKNVSQNADGMFRWAYLLLRELARLKKDGPAAIKAALKRFPKDLDDIYARMLLEIDENDRQEVIILLRWITYARRPLTLGELQDTIIIKAEHNTVATHDRNTPDYILRVLSSLVVTFKDRIEQENEDSGADDLVTAKTRIRLAHFTVQEYLESSRIREGDAKQFHLESKAGHYFLTQSCVTYLIHYSSSSEKHSFEEDFATFPLLQYTAGSWYHHSSLHQSTDVSYELRLLEDESTRHDWLIINSFEPPWPGFGWSSAHMGQALHYASSTGLVEVARQLLAASADVNADSWHALVVASTRGHERVVEMLLSSGADVDAHDAHCESALLSASRAGHERVVEMLLEAGADVNADSMWGTAVRTASAVGHERVVKILLAAGADVNADVGHQNALMTASGGGHEKVVEMLLAAGADVNIRDEYSGNALEQACRGGYERVVEMLLAAGAAVNAHGEYGTALVAASMKGYAGLVELLLAAGADVNAYDRYNGTALEVASTRGHKRVVRMLRDAHAAITKD